MGVDEGGTETEREICIHTLYKIIYFVGVDEGKKG